MTNLRISELPAIPTLDPLDSFPMVDNTDGSNAAATVGQLDDRYPRKSVIYTRETLTWPATVAQADISSGWRAPTAGTLISVDIWCDTAPTVGVITVDLHKNGTTVFTTQSNRPEIAISGTSDTSGTVEVTSMVAGDLFQFHIDALNASDQGNIGQLFCRMVWTEDYA